MGMFAPKNIFPCTTCVTAGGGEVVTNVLTAKVRVSKEELATLGSANITLIDAPDPGYAILPINIAANYIYGTEDYDYSGTAPYIIIKHAASTAVLFSCSDLIATGPFTNLFSLQASFAMSLAPDSGLVANAPMILACQNDATQGNGILDVYITYMIISI